MKDLQPEVDGLNSCLDEDEAPYRVIALYAHPAQLSAVQTTKVFEALEMLENGAFNVAENAKNRGDDYGVGYAQAMAKMARDTLDVLSAPALPAEGVPAFMPVAHTHHCTARTADGSCEECEGHAQAMAVWNAERTALAATQPAAQGMDAQNRYYLQNARHHAMVGNCPSFWRKGGGYTTNLDEAERFTLEAAMKQHKCRETDLPWPCSEVDKLRRPTIDFQYLPRSWDEQCAALAAQAKQGGTA